MKGEGVREGYQKICPFCGSTRITPRTRKGGHWCRACKRAIVPPDNYPLEVPATWRSGPKISMKERAQAQGVSL